MEKLFEYSNKLIYDCHKDLKVVFTSSSVLDIKNEIADLNSKVVIYSMQNFSSQEYLKWFL